jgi:ABC-type bacteriocin/lantibiotic exporter with double-glycine peptidase domain
MCDIGVYSRHYFKFIVDNSNYSGKIKMRLIRQPQNSTLCGIACVAMIAEKSLTLVIQKAIDLFKWDPKTVKTDSRTNKKDILKLLTKCGFSRRNTFKNFSSWDNIEGLNLVAVRYSPKTGNWHWIVAKRNRKTLKIYDPQKESPIEYRENEKLDGRTYRGKWFIRIN